MTERRRTIQPGVAVALLGVLIASAGGCFRFGIDEYARERKRGGFASVGLAGGGSSYTCKRRCPVESSDIGVTASAGKLISKGAAITVDARLLSRPSRLHYDHVELGASYRRWLIPFAWASAGGGIVRQTTEAFDDARRLGAAAMGAVGLELPMSNQVTLDIRIDVGTGFVPERSYVEAFGGLALTIHTAPIEAQPDDELPLVE